MYRANLTTRQLEVFLAVAETLSFTTASHMLYVSQSTVSDHIRELELTLKTKLLARNRRSVALTSAGDRLLDYARTVLRTLQEAEEVVSGMREEYCGRLSVGCASTILVNRMPILLAKFLREYPQVEIAIEAGSRQEIIRNLREGAVDLAIITLPVIGSEVVKTHLFEEPFVLIVPSSHPAASMKKFTPQILADETFLLYKPGTGTRKAIDRFFFRQKLTPKVPVVVNDSNVILELVARGLGMSMLPAYSLPLDKPAGVKAFPLKGLKRSLGIAYLKAQMLRPAALAFIQATRGYFHDANIAARKSR